MRKKEQLLWDAMKEHEAYGMKLVRMENIAADGFPDVYVMGSGNWVELKAPTKIPKREGTPVLGCEGLRISQKNWNMQNTQGGRVRSFILIRLPGTRELLLIPGALAMIVNDMTLKELRAASIASDWATINQAVMI